MARNILSVLALGVVALGHPAAVLADAQDRLRMTVVVRNYVAASADVVGRSRRVAAVPYGAIGIDITWMDDDGFAQAMGADRRGSCAFARSVFFVDLLAGLKSNRHALGTANSGTRLVRIAYKRVENVSQSLDIDSAIALGHVIAHEIGHALLPPESHSASGLMQANMDLRLASQGGLTFSREQASEIRNALPRLTTGSCNDLVIARPDAEHHAPKQGR